LFFETVYLKIFALLRTHRRSANRDNNMDISGLFTWEEGLPRPQWDLIANFVESHYESDALHDAWTEAARQWLMKLTGAFE
jgi:hypothetical protein